MEVKREGLSGNSHHSLSKSHQSTDPSNTLRIPFNNPFTLTSIKSRWFHPTVRYVWFNLRGHNSRVVSINKHSFGHKVRAVGNKKKSEMKLKIGPLFVVCLSIFIGIFFVMCVCSLCDLTFYCKNNIFPLKKLAMIYFSNKQNRKNNSKPRKIREQRNRHLKR